LGLVGGNGFKVSRVGNDDGTGTILVKDIDSGAYFGHVEIGLVKME
jgi:hypothetical protein